MTQGLVTLTKNNEVIMKIIAGSDGEAAKKLVEEIKNFHKIPNLSEAYNLAIKAGFGSEDDLVVMDKESEYSLIEEPPTPLYRKTFNKPEFNPRWESGIADYTEVISL